MLMTDSCTNVCIEDCNISTGGDAISIKSGWDQYGIAYKSPSSNIWIRRVVSSAPTGSGFAIGSEMSGGVSNIKVGFCHAWLWEIPEEFLPTSLCLFTDEAK
jgi:polygalacturonase